MAPFCSCPASLVSRKFFAVGPGCAKCFFLLRSVGRRDLSAGPQQKKKTPPRVFFFFAAATAKGTGRRSPVGRRHGARAKKKTLFALAPCRRPTGLLLPLPFPGAGAKKKNTLGGVFFFALAPWRRPTGLLLPLPFAGAAAKKKKHPGWCFFFALAPCRRPTGLLLPVPFARAAAKKKKYPGWCFFFAAAPRGRSLTHCGPGWRCLPLGGVVFFFAAAPPGPGWCYFFFAVAPPGRSLTHGGLGRFRQGPGSVIFLLRPRRVFLDNNKKCLGYYIGSKKTRRGHSKKKTPLPPKTY